jgi:dCMP deaminase
MKAESAAITKWDKRFLQLCDVIGSWSEDRSRQVGSVIVGPAKEVRALGFNGLPRGISGAVQERYARVGGEKYYWFEHAERNAIFNAARSGVSTDSCSMYSNLFPCADCTRAIIQSGIVQLNSYSAPEDDEVFRRSYEIAREMLREASVEVRILGVRPRKPIATP